MRRIALLSAAVTLAVASLCAPAQESRLPDIGSSAGELLNPLQEEQYGAMMLAQLRQYDYILSDPLVDSWLDTLGSSGLSPPPASPTKPAGARDICSASALASPIRVVVTGCVIR